MRILYVSPHGRDHWTGEHPEPTPDGTGPLATASAARDRIRRLKAAGPWPAGGIAVVFRGGVYPLAEPLRLGTEDSGAAGSPIRYSAFPGERPRWIGGCDLSSALRPIIDPEILARLPAEVHATARQIDLKTCGIASCGEWRPHGYYRRSIAPLELFHNGRPLTLARWPKKPPIPNRGYARIKSVENGWITFAAEAPLRWTGEGLQVDGYWKTDWATQAWSVTAFDGLRHRFRIDAEFNSGVTPTPGKRLYFFNVLEELRAPGDYVLDPLRNRVYVVLPEPDRPGELIASVLEEPLVILQEVSHVRFENLQIEGGRGDGVWVEGGESVAIAGCEIRNLGQDGIVLRRGANHSVLGCDVHQVGMRGVSIGAGDRKTLTPCGHRVHNCHLHHTARRGKTYHGAITLEYDFGVTGDPPSCGVTITHNRLHDHPHTLLFFWGNEHRIERNEFYNFTLEGDDCGCLYAGRDFTFQGTIIRRNYFHHGGDSGNEEWGSSGIYLDDGAGGARIEENLFLWVNRAVQAGGGINTIIARNLFVNGTPAIWFDERCASARADRGETMVHGYMKQKFAEVAAEGPLYRSRYPHLDRVAEALAAGSGVRAWGAVIRGNLVVGTRGWLNSAWTEMPAHVDCRDNTVIPEPQPRAGGPPPELAARMAGVAASALPVEWDEEPIGLIRDAWREKLEEVWTAIEVVQPPSATGAPGEARLIVRNAGDFPARGREIVEIRRRRHAAAQTWVEVDYDVAPGAEKAFVFAVPRPADFTEEETEIYLISRGETIRPAWTVTPVACEAVAEWEETVRRPRKGPRPMPGEATVRLTSRSDHPVEYELQVAASPEGEVALTGLDAAHGPLLPRATARWTLRIEPRADRLISRVGLTARGPGLSPARLDLPVEFDVPHWETGVGLDDLAGRAAGMAVFPVAREFPNGRPVAPLAELRLARSGDAWLVAGRVNDPAPGVTESIWDGSCIELFAAPLDQVRLAKVFGNLRIGHVLLVPADRARPARLLRFHEDGSQPIPDGAIRTLPEAGGYRVEARVPLEALELPPGSREFLFEIQVTTGFSSAHPQRRGTCFGSAAAYKEAGRFALAVTAGGISPV